MQKDYYKILDLKPNAGVDDIKQAYRQLAKKFHPDINNSPYAHEKFIEISEAYEFLTEQLSNTTQKAKDQQDDSTTAEFIEEMRRHAKEKARELARKRLEKLKKEHEAFQISGIYDLGVLANYTFRYGVLLLCLFMIIWPIILTIVNIYLPWPVKIIVAFIGSLGIYNIYQNRTTYFSQGKLYYNYSKIKSLFLQSNESTIEECYFSPGRKASARPYNLEMFRIKEIQLHNYGPAQHAVGYDQKSVSLSIPRSQHAFFVHVAVIFVKIVLFFLSIILLTFDSLLWRTIIGFVIALAGSRLILFFTQTKSPVSYLLTTSIIIRGIVWLTIIIAFSSFQLRPLNISTAESVYAIVVFIILFDTFLDQFLNYISKQKCRSPIFKQHPLIQSHLEKGFQFSHEMPVVSFFYPSFKWFLG